MFLQVIVKLVSINEACMSTMELLYVLRREQCALRRPCLLRCSSYHSSLRMQDPKVVIIFEQFQLLKLVGKIDFVKCSC